jgi:hypothetical protein
MNKSVSLENQKAISKHRNKVPSWDCDHTQDTSCFHSVAKAASVVLELLQNKINSI